MSRLRKASRNVGIGGSIIRFASKKSTIINQSESMPSPIKSSQFGDKSNTRLIHRMQNSPNEIIESSTKHQ